MSASHPLLQKIEVAETVSGEFYWDVRATTPLASSSATGPQSKFDLLVWLGLMPDTQILSNKLIKLVGEHIFETLWRKANYTSIFSALERRRQAASSLFDPVEQEELWQCWRLVAKLRALQEIDYLFNQATLSESDISTRFAQTRTAVAELYPQPQEQEEKKWLDLELLKLENGLKLAKTTKDRNALLQQAQQNLFRGLFAYFQMKQGKLSAKQHHILARENWENTNITREAENILQNWEFGETGLIKDSMLFRNDGGDIFYSGTYPEANKRRLLFAAHLGEVLGPRLGLDANTNTNPDVFNEKNNNEKYRLHEVMANFQQLKKEISKKNDRP